MISRLPELQLTRCLKPSSGKTPAHQVGPSEAFRLSRHLRVRLSTAVFLAEAPTADRAQHSSLPLIDCQRTDAPYLLRGGVANRLPTRHRAMVALFIPPSYGGRRSLAASRQHTAGARHSLRQRVAILASRRIFHRSRLYLCTRRLLRFR
jgi:hypothetical protein